MQFNLDKLSNQARFVQMIIDDQLVVSKKKKDVLIAELKNKGFRPFLKTADAVKNGELEEFAENDEELEDSVATGTHGYEYLLNVGCIALLFRGIALMQNR